MMSLLPLQYSTLSRAVKEALVLKNARIRILNARIMVLTEDLEIAEGEAGRAQEHAGYLQGRINLIVDAATSVQDDLEAAETKLKEIAKLVDSDWNNGMIPHSYELTAAVRRILK